MVAGEVDILKEAAVVMADEVVAIITRTLQEAIALKNGRQCHWKRELESIMLGISMLIEVEEEVDAIIVKIIILMPLEIQEMPLLYPLIISRMMMAMVVAG